MSQETADHTSDGAGHEDGYIFPENIGRGYGSELILEAISSVLFAAKS